MKGKSLTVYKITDKNRQTHGGCQWGENITHTADGQGDLCTEHWIHGYVDPVLAVMINPIHGDFDVKTMWMWECVADVEVDDGLKIGCTSLTTIKEILIPKITLEQRIGFGILSALEICNAPDFVQWANEWLCDSDRSEAAAEVAAWAAARAAARAAWAAAWAAQAAAEAAEKKIDFVSIAKKAMEIK